MKRELLTRWQRAVAAACIDAAGLDEHTRDSMRPVVKRATLRRIRARWRRAEKPAETMTVFEFRRAPCPSSTVAGWVVLGQMFDTEAAKTAALDLTEHDCGIFYVVGQPHICADVAMLPHEKNRLLRP